MTRRRLTVAALLAGVLLAACESDVSEPLADRAELAGLLDGRGGVGAYPSHTLPGLLHAAVRSVYSEHGAGAARALLNDLRRVREQTRAASGGNGEGMAAATLAARSEELDIVLRVFGAGVVETTIQAVRAETARLEGELNGGLAAPARQRAGELLGQAGAHLEQAGSAVRSGNTRGALDHAVQAGAIAERVRHLATAERRVAALPELFDHAVARLRATGDGADARSRLASYNALQRAAEDIVRSGDHQRAHSALKAARDEQIRIVLEVVGTEPVGRMLREAGAALAELDAGLASARAGGRDVTRLGRMAGSAHDMLGRAGAALDDGDAATALDLGSHAAGLINTLRLNLPR